MKYSRTRPPTDRKLSNQLLLAGWKKLKEPTNLGMAIVQSVPFMLINGLIFMVIAFYLYPPLKELLNSKHGFSFNFEINAHLLMQIAAVFIFMAIHELLHACFIPNVLKSNKTFLGINGLIGFVSTTESIKKSRFIIISIAPLILLSVILPFVLSVFGLLSVFTLFLCLINAMGSCVDCLTTFNVATQVSRNSYVVSNGSETYFK